MQFARYLKERILTVDLWNGDSLMHFGTCKVPLASFLRQGADSKSLAHEYDICEPDFGQALGSLQLFVSNQGRKIPALPSRRGTSTADNSNGFTGHKMKKKVVSKPIENIQELINGGDIDNMAMQYT